MSAKQLAFIVLLVVMAIVVGVIGAWWAAAVFVVVIGILLFRWYRSDSANKKGS